MNYLYHLVPGDIQDNTLYPLNELKTRYPDIYKQQASKYVGREYIMQQKIPILDCLWNDVLHFSAVHPKDIKQALIESGQDFNFKMNYYQIDPKLIDPKNAIIYLYSHKNSEDKMNKENFTSYKPDELIKFSSVPFATKDYYRQMISEKKRPLLYYKIPHIFYKGILDINNLPIISV